MGKKNYIREDISSHKTELLGQEDLLVLESESDGGIYCAIHRRYFDKKKTACPSCGSEKTRCSKLVKRKFKDIILHGEDFEVVDLHFYQRYFRCDNCGESVFPEPIDFGQKSVHYTNRLADLLAEGTFQHSYKKVCEHFGVPASTASVGAIMRRQIQMRESQLYPPKTAEVLCVVELPFFGNVYPAVLSFSNGTTYCLDILQDNSDTAYSRYFKTLDAPQVQTVCIDPNDSLQTSVATWFPRATMVLTDECLLRMARKAMIEAIAYEGKRLPLQHKKDRLTLHAKHLPDANTRKQVRVVLDGRPKLKAVYESYQRFIDVLETERTYEAVKEWMVSRPRDQKFFDELCDVIEIYEAEIRRFFASVKSMPDSYHSAVKSIFDAVEIMPHCIFDVFRARSLLTAKHDDTYENGRIVRLGIPVSRMTQKMNEITDNIKEERYYEL